MELFLKNGDYVPDGKGGFTHVSGGEELLQRVLFKLTARRGGFPLLPRLGSRLYLLPGRKPGEWDMLARFYISEALAEEKELNVTEVTVTPKGSGAAIEITAEYRGKTMALMVEV